MIDRENGQRRTFGKPREDMILAHSKFELLNKLHQIKDLLDTITY